MLLTARIPAGVFLFTLLLAACGYVGDPMPPALNIPVPVEDLAAVERGDEIVIQFTVPELTTDGLVLKKFGELDLRIGVEGLNPFHQPTWENHASRIPVDGEPGPGGIRVTTGAAAWVGREVLIGVRLSNHNGRWSQWSNFAALHVTEPLAKPAGLDAKPAAEGVRLSWTMPQQRQGLRYRVFRRAAEADRFILAAEPDQPNWLDTGAAFDASYEYRVQATLRVGDDVAESEVTDAVQVTVEDTFAPAAPGGLIAVAGLDTIEVTWSRSREPDFAFYRVYRRRGDGARVMVKDNLATPAFTDDNIVTKQEYRYTVTSVDRKGNESEPSPEVSRTAP